MVTLPGCPVCDATGTRHRYTKFGLPLVECLGCGLVYANPRLTKEEIWQRYSPDYFWNEYMPTIGARDGQFDLAHFDDRHRAMLQLIAGEVPGRGALLEVGTGAGFFLKAAERAGWTVAGIEVSSEAVEFARGRLGLDVRRESAETLSFEPGSFRAAVMFDVIEHLLDPVQALRHVGRALGPGGSLIVSTPNVEALSHTALGSAWAVLSPAEHLYNFSALTLTRLLQRAGFPAVRVVRDYAGLGVYETMNPRYTHSPTSARAKLYAGLIAGFGRWCYRDIQRVGKADTLLVVASTPLT